MYYNFDDCWQHGTTLVKYEGKHEKKVGLEELKAPEGWIFKDNWEVDMNRIVDEEGELVLSGNRLSELSLSLSLSFRTGWEYTTEAGLNSPYVPFERNIHLNRRRRWIRIRVRNHDTEAIEKKKVNKEYFFTHGTGL